MLCCSQLAETVNRSVEAISNIERGASLPPLDTLPEICAVCDLALSDIFENPARSQSKHRTELEMSVRMMLRALDDKHAQLARNVISSVRDVSSDRVGLKGTICATLCSNCAIFAI